MNNVIGFETKIAFRSIFRRATAALLVVRTRKCVDLRSDGCCQSRVTVARALLLFMFSIASVDAFGASQCYQWRDNTAEGWYADPQAACDAIVTQWQALQPTWTYGAGVFVMVSFPQGSCRASFDKHDGNSIQYNSTGPVFRNSSPGCQFFAAKDRPKSESKQCPKAVGQSFVADPINPATGAVISAEGDCKAPNPDGLLPFNRFYDSTDSTQTNLGVAWHGSFSRRVTPITFVPTIRQYQPGNPDNSSLYSDEATACTSGFADIQSRVPNWAGATAQYVNGTCELIKNGVVIGTLQIYSNSGLPAPFPTTIAYDVTRDDGQVVHFTIQGGVITSPPSTNLKLQPISGGYSLIDAGDTVETYDVNGVLQSITSRSGVVQTMSYDGSGRLVGVVDSFGHHLAFSYDTQNRLVSVIRQ